MRIRVGKGVTSLLWGVTNLNRRRFGGEEVKRKREKGHWGNQLRGKEDAGWKE